MSPPSTHSASSSRSKSRVFEDEEADLSAVYGEDEPLLPSDRTSGGLYRGLSARQVQMIAVAGTIGTGLFLGTSKSLAEGGPASILIAYAVIGLIVYVTLLLLGEMATQYPVAGSFNAYASRFFSPSYAFALSYNYWFNDAVSVAADLVAAQLVLQFWTPWNTWVVSLIFWVFLVGVNACNVGAYGELEYWLSSIKVSTIILFIIVGIVVNCGGNPAHEYIGARYWSIEGAPFVGGFGGFAKVFVTASFAYGGTESIGITAGETRNPSKNMPRVVKLVFWRILLFYILSILLIGLNVPWNYPGLSSKTTSTSAFTIVFEQVGSKAAGSFMNTVILTSVLSAGNHALYAGTRVLYGLAVTEPVPQAPQIFAWTTPNGKVPLPALLATASVSVLCFTSSFIGNGQLWSWLQNIVGVSNQIAWLSIGLASWRFRKAWLVQGRSLDELKFKASWTWPWGPYFVVIAVTCLILIQGWSSVFPKFRAVDFVSLYIEIPLMFVMYVGWLLSRRMAARAQNDILDFSFCDLKGFTDLVEIRTLDLRKDEYHEQIDDREDEALRDKRLNRGNLGIFWKMYYSIA